MSTVAREMLELNVEEINLLKSLNLISGKGVVGWDAVAQGSNSNTPIARLTLNMLRENEG